MAKKEAFFIKKTETLEIELYAVRSKDGKWLRSKGQNGYGNSWVDEFSKAKIWSRPGPAKAQVTWWGTNYPNFGVPDLVQIVSGTCNYLDQTQRVEDAARKKIIQKAQDKVNNIEYRINNYLQRTKTDKDQIERWKSELEVAKKDLEKIKAK